MGGIEGGFKNRERRVRSCTWSIQTFNMQGDDTRSKGRAPRKEEDLIRRLKKGSYSRATKKEANHLRLRTISTKDLLSPGAKSGVSVRGWRENGDSGRGKRPLDFNIFEATYCSVQRRNSYRKTFLSPGSGVLKGKKNRRLECVGETVAAEEGKETQAERTLQREDDQTHACSGRLI